MTNAAAGGEGKGGARSRSPSARQGRLGDAEPHECHPVGDRAQRVRARAGDICGRLINVGPMTCVVGEVGVRSVAVSGCEVVQAIELVLRDRDWRTVPWTVATVDIGEAHDQVDIAYRGHHRGNGLSVDFVASITARADARLDFEASAVVGAGSSYNRLGVCIVLDSRSVAGASFTGIGEHGRITGRFPEAIGPQEVRDGVLCALHEPVHRLHMSLATGGTLELAFAGDLWETEDQRNWSDGSFKIYSTPLALGFPHRASGETTISQAVRIGAARLPRVKPESQEVCIEVADGTQLSVPPIGCVLQRLPTSATPAQIAHLRMVSLGHLRFNVHLATAGWLAEVVAAAAYCEAIGASLELAVYLHPDSACLLEKLAVLPASARIARLLLIHEDAQTGKANETTPEELIEPARRVLGSRIPIGAGSDFHFCELNRRLPRLDLVDGVFWPINPQAHARDDDTVVGSLAIQGEQAHAAREIAGDKALYVGPVTLAPPARQLPGMTDPRKSAAEADEGDPRHHGLFGAAWTVGSLKYLLEEGAAAVTYYELFGPRGLLTRRDREWGRGRQAYPLFHVLADAAGLRGAPINECESSAPRKVVGLCAGSRGQPRTLMVANLTPSEQDVEIRGLDGAGCVRRLNRETVAAAEGDPRTYRKSAVKHVAMKRWRTSLMPYETLRLDGE